MTDVTPAPAPAPVPAPSPAPALAPAPAPAPAWHGLTDPADIAHLDNKGWKSPQDIYRAYRGAETLIGKDPSSVVPIPRAGDVAGFDQLFNRLGRPDSPDKYDLKAGLPDGTQADDGFMKEIGGLFHKSGLTGDQAKAVAAGYNAIATARQKQAETDALANVTADKQTLQREWGSGYERQLTIAKMAVQELGFTQEEIGAMESAIGYRAVMQRFAELGKRLSDPKFARGDGQPRFDGTLTPAEAGEEIRKMKMDEAFVKSLQDRSHAAHKENKAKWSRLHEIAYPG